MEKFVELVEKANKYNLCNQQVVEYFVLNKGNADALNIELIKTHKEFISALYWVVKSTEGAWIQTPKDYFDFLVETYPYITMSRFAGYNYSLVTNCLYSPPEKFSLYQSMKECDWWGWGTDGHFGLTGFCHQCKERYPELITAEPQPNKLETTELPEIVPRQSFSDLLINCNEAQVIATIKTLINEDTKAKSIALILQAMHEKNIIILDSINKVAKLWHAEFGYCSSVTSLSNGLSRVLVGDRTRFCKDNSQAINNYKQQF